MKTILPLAIALPVLLAACSSEAPQADPATAPASESAADEMASEAPPAPSESASPAATRTLTLEGLDDLVIGRPVPTSSDWKMRGAQASDECLTYSSPRFPGVYAIVEDKAVRRITVGQGSDVRLVEGIGVGASERTVMAQFAGFRSEPHKYEQAPAKYLTAPNAGGKDSALRFEIGSDGKVSLIHVGTSPTLEYVEGCA
jgi:hypothetical protein